MPQSMWNPKNPLRDSVKEERGTGNRQVIDGRSTAVNPVSVQSH